MTDQRGRAETSEAERRPLKECAGTAVSNTSHAILQVALAAATAARGDTAIGGPVGGTVSTAREGQLLGMAGGAVDDAERTRLVLELLCRRVDHLGPLGAGALLKLAINLPS